MAVAKRRGTPVAKPPIGGMGDYAPPETDEEATDVLGGPGGGPTAAAPQAASATVPEEIPRAPVVLPYPDPNARIGGFTETSRPALPGNPVNPANPNTRPRPGVRPFLPPKGPPTYPPGYGPNGGPDTQSLDAVMGFQDQQENPTGGSIYDAPAVQAAYRKSSGQDIIDDPAIAQALKNYRAGPEQQIINQMTLAGLGNSSAMGSAIGQGEGNLLAPMYQDAINREAQRNMFGAQSLSGELNRETSAQQAQIPFLLQMSQNQQNQGNQQINQAMQAGGTARQVQQAALDARYKDFLRRQGLSEQAVNGIFGQLVPSTFGSSSRSGGGLFK